MDAHFPDLMPPKHTSHGVWIPTCCLAEGSKFSYPEWFIYKQSIRLPHRMQSTTLAVQCTLAKKLAAKWHETALWILGLKHIIIRLTMHLLVQYLLRYRHHSCACSGASISCELPLKSCHPFGASASPLKHNSSFTVIQNLLPATCRSGVLAGLPLPLTLESFSLHQNLPHPFHTVSCSLPLTQSTK